MGTFAPTGIEVTPQELERRQEAVEEAVAAERKRVEKERAQQEGEVRSDMAGRAERAVRLKDREADEVRDLLRAAEARAEEAEERVAELEKSQKKESRMGRWRSSPSSGAAGAYQEGVEVARKRQVEQQVAELQEREGCVAQGSTPCMRGR